MEDRPGSFSNVRLDASMEAGGLGTHSLASKVDLHQWIHQVLPVTVKPKNLLHPIHEGIIHCRQKKKFSPLFCSLKHQHPH